MALAWCGDAILHLNEGHRPPKRERPWAPAFERGLARTTSPRGSEAIFNDWLADELWMLRWLDYGCSFDVGRAELATRLAVAREVHRSLRASRVPVEQAAAEAVMVGEMAGAANDWADTVAAMRV